MNIALKAIQPELPLRKKALKHDTNDEEMVRLRFLFTSPRHNGRNWFKVAGSEVISNRGKKKRKGELAQNLSSQVAEI